MPTLAHMLLSGHQSLPLLRHARHVLLGPEVGGGGRGGGAVACSFCPSVPVVAHSGHLFNCRSFPSQCPHPKQLPSYQAAPSLQNPEPMLQALEPLETSNVPDGQSCCHCQPGSLRTHHLLKVLGGGFGGF